jgi:hypothetical protein
MSGFFHIQEMEDMFGSIREAVPAYQASAHVPETELLMLRRGPHCQRYTP